MKLAFISDIHEDVVSLSIAMNKIHNLGVDKIICLGDIAGYNFKYYDYHHTRNASECLAILRKYCDIIVPGNHDYHAIKKIPEMSPGFNFPADWYELDYFRKKRIGGRRLWDYDDADLHPKLRTEDVDFLSGLKQYEILEAENYNLLLSHYLFPNLSGMLVDFFRFPGDFNEHFRFMSDNNCLASVTGHEHIPGLSYVSKDKASIKRMGKKQICSAPFILMAPSVANGRNKSGFMILDTITNKAMSYRI
ncbi:MAG: metallophosphoesterase family protein [Bacteroidales bacterium]